MADEQHRPRARRATAESKHQLVNLLVTEIERAYAVEGPARGGQTLRQMLMALDLDALTTLLYECGLETEPLREEEDVERRD